MDPEVVLKQRWIPDRKGIPGPDVERVRVVSAPYRLLGIIALPGRLIVRIDP